MPETGPSPKPPRENKQKTQHHPQKEACPISCKSADMQSKPKSRKKDAWEEGVPEEAAENQHYFKGGEGRKESNKKKRCASRRGCLTGKARSAIQAG